MKKRAFTLVEVMIVLAIIGLLVLIILPAVRKNNENKVPDKSDIEAGRSNDRLLSAESHRSSTMSEDVNETRRVSHLNGDAVAPGEITRPYPVFWNEMSYVEMKDPQTGMVIMRQYPIAGTIVFREPSRIASSHGATERWNIYEGAVGRDLSRAGFGPDNLVAYADVVPIASVLDRASIPPNGRASLVLPQATLVWHVYTPCVNDPDKYAVRDVVLTDSRWRVCGQIEGDILIVSGPADENDRQKYRDMTANLLDANGERLNLATPQINRIAERYLYDSLSRRIIQLIDVDYYSD
jgi:prepilin-type N-terminal cleavage/methylation domain-containing protein